MTKGGPILKNGKIKGKRPPRGIKPSLRTKYIRRTKQ
jgi:hypothetical protein